MPGGVGRDDTPVALKGPDTVLAARVGAAVVVDKFVSALLVFMARRHVEKGQSAVLDEPVTLGFELDAEKCVVGRSLFAIASDDMAPRGQKSVARWQIGRAMVHVGFCDAGGRNFKTGLERLSQYLGV